MGRGERKGRERGWKKELRCVMSVCQLHTRNVNTVYYKLELIKKYSLKIKSICNSFTMSQQPVMKGECCPLWPCRPGLEPYSFEILVVLGKVQSDGCHRTHLGTWNTTRLWPRKSLSVATTGMAVPVCCLNVPHFPSAPGTIFPDWKRRKVGFNMDDHNESNVYYPHRFIFKRKIG